MTQIYISTKSSHNPSLTHIEAGLSTIKSWMRYNLSKRTVTNRGHWH
uniref:Uncharacterized protein n=1 Tax=Anguilla anguilla TaxID=7936 RepID=A0A0E9WQ59_ANGAN